MSAWMGDVNMKVDKHDEGFNEVEGTVTRVEVKQVTASSTSTSSCQKSGRFFVNTQDTINSARERGSQKSLLSCTHAL
jgi:hypothetical protein